jgi:hypothetical protein
MGTINEEMMKQARKIVKDTVVVVPQRQSTSTAEQQKEASNVS